MSKQSYSKKSVKYTPRGSIVTVEGAHCLKKDRSEPGVTPSMRGAASRAAKSILKQMRSGKEEAVLTR
ncbi:hypothetical protein [Deinococcus radiophilus]|uniref:Uncharacterized protein n=1 Tax=Deinococcus radiophilus TaxID=32062 RepID=A0A3S0KL14_9DEIO|nr:hypothetical protein [Deinococcus radiophilus]RTR29029.1 hypothetical protein EJ104_04080 [Deinococcus radiophilus]